MPRQSLIAPLDCASAPTKARALPSEWPLIAAAVVEGAVPRYQHRRQLRTTYYVHAVSGVPRGLAGH